MTDEQKQRLVNAEERARAVLEYPALDRALVYKMLYAAGIRINDVESIISREVKR